MDEPLSCVRLMPALLLAAHLARSLLASSSQGAPSVSIVASSVAGITSSLASLRALAVRRRRLDRVVGEQCALAASVSGNFGLAMPHESYAQTLKPSVSALVYWQTRSDRQRALDGHSAQPRSSES